MLQTRSWRVAIIALSCNLLLSFSLILFMEEYQSEPIQLYLHAHKQLFESWKAQPFSDILLSDPESGCNPYKGYEPLFSRRWNGTHALCLAKKYNTGYQALRKQNGGEDCDGITLSSVRYIDMSSLSSAHNSLLCARRAGPSYIESTTVNPITKRCP